LEFGVWSSDWTDWTYWTYWTDDKKTCAFLTRPRRSRHSRARRPCHAKKEY